MIIKLRKQRSMGIFALIFAVLGWYFTETQINLKYVIASSYTVSPKFFPKLVLICIAISGIMLLVHSFMKKDDDIVEISLKDELPVIILFLAILAYIALFNVLGFIISTLLISNFLLFMQGSRNWKYYAIVSGMTLLVFVIFVFLFSIRLPWGFPLGLIFG